MEQIVFSADSHVIEPPDLWEKRLDRKYRDRGPRVEKRLPPGGTTELLYFVCPDVEPVLVPSFHLGFANVMEKGQAYLDGLALGWDLAPPSLHDPAERLKEQDTDGVVGELMFPSMSMVVHGIKDPQLQAAACRAFNEWTIEYCSYNPDRMVPIGLIPADVDLGIQELERARDLGLKGAFIRAVADRLYSDPSFERFWSAAEDVGIPRTIHDLVLRGKISFNGANYIALPQESQLIVSDLIVGGVFERHPQLRIVSAENDVSWLPHLLFRMDHREEKLARTMSLGQGGDNLTSSLSMTPTEYAARNLWASTVFENEVLEHTIPFFPADHLMWGSDYPHPDGSFPYSAKMLSEFYNNVTPAEKALIIGGSAIALYEINVANLGEARLSSV
jgi:predicted TIM-barrel fold metal-dependent hydrolase